MAGAGPTFHGGANGPTSAGMSAMYPANSHMSPNPQSNASASHTTAMGGGGGPGGGAAGSINSATSVTVKQEVISSPGTPGSIGSPVPSGPMMNPGGPGGPGSAGGAPPGPYPGGMSPGHPYGAGMPNSGMTRAPGPVNTSSSLAQLQQMQMRHNPQGYGPPSSSYGPVGGMGQPGPGMGGPGMHPGETKTTRMMNLHGKS